MYVGFQTSRVTDTIPRRGVIIDVSTFATLTMHVNSLVREALHGIGLLRA